MEEPLKKKFLLKISGGNYTEFEPERMRFHKEDFSLEILNTSRDDRRLYEYSVSKGSEEEVWQIQLEVFELEANPSLLLESPGFLLDIPSLPLEFHAVFLDAVVFFFFPGCSHHFGSSSFPRRWKTPISVPKSCNSRLSPEPVADPIIRILRRESSNGSCSLVLRCSSERGDEVSYSWAGRDDGTGGICAGGGSVLNLSYALRSAAFGCVCTASNP
ncbi:hypothetical protein DV515_00017527, partial [Chloebia gouldiae]